LQQGAVHRGKRGRQATPIKKKIQTSGIDFYPLNLRHKFSTMYRSHNCGELTAANINQEVTLAGWVQSHATKVL
jgi:hypothetical protein